MYIIFFIVKSSTKTPNNALNIRIIKYDNALMKNKGYNMMKMKCGGEGWNVPEKLGQISLKRLQIQLPSFQVQHRILSFVREDF